MSRPTGVRNPDYQTTRDALIAKLERRLIDPPDHPNMNELARAADVSIPTLKHYFGDRAGVVDAVLKDGGERGRRFMAIASEPKDDLETSMVDLARFVVQGFVRGRLGDLHAVGFAETFREPGKSAAYLALILDPMIDSVAIRMRCHMDRGQMVAVEPRTAALSFLGGLFLVLLHQIDFDGSRHNPLNLDTFAVDHARAFSRAMRPSDES